MDSKHKEKTDLINQKLEKTLPKRKQAMAEEQWEKAAEYNDEIKGLNYRLSILNQTDSRLGEIAFEIDLLINKWVDKFESQMSIPDKGVRQVDASILSDEIESLLVEYSLESGEEVTVFEVPMSKFLESEIGTVKCNGALYSVHHLIKEWIGSITGNIRSNVVNTWNPNQKVREIASKYYNECILRMKELE